MFTGIQKETVIDQPINQVTLVNLKYQIYIVLFYLCITIKECRIDI